MRDAQRPPVPVAHLNYGIGVTPTMDQYLLDNGMTADEYQFFMKHDRDIRTGNDYYQANEHPDQPARWKPRLRAHVFGDHVITRTIPRHNLPVMHIETTWIPNRAVAGILGEHPASLA